MNKLAFSRAHYQAVKLRVCEDHPDLDEETLADTVEGLTDLHDIVAAILRSAVTDEALGKGLRVRISDESLVPPQYWEPRDPRLNRQSLAVDLKAGQSIEGAILGNPEPVLSVRVK